MNDPVTEASAAAPTTPRPPDPRWHRASEHPAHTLAPLDGASLGGDITVEVWLGPKNHVGSQYFRLHLDTEDLGRPTEPVAFGLQNSGPFPGFNWIELLEWREVLTLPDGRAVQVPEAVERRLFQRLGELIPQGGHLMAEYDSPARTITARALAAGAPPIATPLGALLHAAGVGDAFRDWYIPEGGREGPRKLQGFRAVDGDHARRRALEMIPALEAFLASDADLDWNMLAQTRPIAQEALDALRERYAEQ